MALAALAGEPTADAARTPAPPDAAADAGAPWIRLLQHRFGGTGALAVHAHGNQLLAAHL
jgi:hypothetical protein